jgi:hypothetical protein
MTDPSPTTQGAQPTERHSRLGLLTLFALLALGIGYIAYNVEEGRAGGLPSVLVEYTVWVALIGVAMLRSPRAVLRISDPFLALMGLAFNFIVSPGILWLHGADLEATWFEVGRIRMDIFVQIQWLHVMFLLSLSLVYFALAPRPRFTAVAWDPDFELPKPAAWIVLGVLPFALSVVQRIITTGHITATQSYGEVWSNDYAALSAAQVEGGSALLVSQIFGKVWFLPWLVLSIGEGLLLARLLRAGRRIPIVLFALQLPVMLVLGTGGRSVIVAPFFIALLIADVLAGPLRWRWVLSVGGVAMVGLNFFAYYRAFRDQEVGQAIALANERFTSMSRSESFSAESTVMLVKEHFAIAWTDANNYSRGISYFTESVLSLLPQQIVPDKVHFLGTANFLAHQLLGRAADLGSGIAGSMIVDGYMIGRELGVIVLGAVLGVVAGGIVRVLSVGSERADGKPMLWAVVLLMSWSLQSIHFYRNDFAAIVSQVGSVIVLPSLIFLLWVRLTPTSPWARRVPIAR